MSHFKPRALEFLRSEDGATTVEYAVLFALAVALCLAAAAALGSETDGAPRGGGRAVHVCS